MATLAELIKVVRLTRGDRGSRRRMLQMLSILRANEVSRGMTPEKAVKVLEELGPTYVKMGQLASTRTDVLPKEYCDALSQLHANVAPMPFEQVLEEVSLSYGRSWRCAFSWIDSTPLGSASIAQVHKGSLHDGSVVAIKVRRPGIAEEMAADIALMKRVLATVELLANSHRVMLLSFDSLVSELEQTSASEVDFNVELSNLVEFKRAIAHQRGVSSPTPYPALSNESVLVMEYVDGFPVDDAAVCSGAHAVDADNLAERLVQSYMSQVLDIGFFHADPHAGNIMVRNGQIVWIDLGMVGTLTSNQRRLVGRMFRAVATGDSSMLMEAVVGMSSVVGEVRYSALEATLHRMLERYSTADLRDVDMGAVFGELVEVMREGNLVMHRSVAMLVRGIVSLEGVLEVISPKANVFSMVSRHLMRQSLHGVQAQAQALGDVSACARSLSASMRLPLQLSQTLGMLGRGEVEARANIEVEGKALGSIYAIAGRLSLSLISAGLFVGSSLLCTTDMRPRVLEVPILGILGYLGAFVLGVYVIVVTFKSRHQLANGERVR